MIMKKFQVVLGKSYLVTIKAENEELAKEYSEFYTGDIRDISSKNNRRKDKFTIDEIECTVNEAFDVKEI